MERARKITGESLLPQETSLNQSSRRCEPPAWLHKCLHNETLTALKRTLQPLHLPLSGYHRGLSCSFRKHPNISGPFADNERHSHCQDCFWNILKPRGYRFECWEIESVHHDSGCHGTAEITGVFSTPFPFLYTQTTSEKAVSDVYETLLPGIVPSMSPMWRVWQSSVSA